MLRDSLLGLTGRDLAGPGQSQAEAARRIFHAPYAVLSHNTDPDPILTYANLTCLRLFGLDWDRLVSTPSRYTAAAADREERNRLLQRVGEYGYIDDYTGIRVSTDGRRFSIENATVWNLTDAAGAYRGQAATFNRWVYL